MNGDAASEVLLAGVTLGMAWRLDRARPGLALGAGLVGLAALLGAFRYSGVTLARAPHDLASLAAACAGLPLLAAGLRWPRSAFAARPAGAAAAAAGATLLAVLLVSGLRQGWWWRAVPAVSVLLMLWVALREGGALRTAAAVLLAGAFAADALGLSLAPLNGPQQLHVLMSGALLLLWADLAARRG